MDSMRAIATIAIVGFHVANSYGVADEPGFLRQLAGRLNVGVWIFFVISAFLLYRPFVAARLRGERMISLRGFAWRRFLRIFPAYWVALIVYTVWLDVPGVFTASHAPRLLLLVQNYWTGTFGLGLGQAWSLSVELAFYVFLGLLAAVFLARHAQTSVRLELSVVALVAAGAYVFRWHLLHHPTALQSAVLPWYLDAFAAGMALAVLSAHYERASKPRLVSVIERFPALPWTVAALLYWFLATRIGLTGDYRQPVSLSQNLWLSTLYTPIAVCVVLPAIWGDPGHGIVRRLLGWRPILFLGKVSYGIFLYQGLAIVLTLRWGLRDIVVPHLSYALWYLVTLALSTVFATISWYALESPVLRLKRRVRREPATVAAPLAPLVENQPG
jgi:peptidoglycan/LPS O-acetylase OafA/YrhL